MSELFAFITYVCLLVLFLALVGTLIIAYKLYAVIKNRDVRDAETNRILADLRTQINRLRDKIDGKK